MEQQGELGAAAGAQTPITEPALAVVIVFGVVSKTFATIGAVSRPVRSLGRPVVRVALRPPLVPAPLQPATWLSRAAGRGTEYRDEVLQDLDDLLDRLLPAFVSEMTRHLDVGALAQDVIADVDLPEIIRASTSAVASDTLLGVRMQSISGDEAIGRAMGRLRLRLARRTPASSQVPDAVAPANGSVVLPATTGDAPVRTP